MGAPRRSDRDQRPLKSLDALSEAERRRVPFLGLPRTPQHGLSWFAVRLSHSLGYLAEVRRPVGIEIEAACGRFDQPIGGHQQGNGVGHRMVVADPWQTRSRTAAQMNPLAGFTQRRDERIDHARSLVCET
jgi:hypothetical protein